jgi:hypothetical protein
MAWARGALVFTNHRHDTGSGLFVFDAKTFTLRARAEMPPEATHTGGLAWDGHDLWAADYNANRVYRIDLESTIARGRAVVLEAYPTGMRGTSAVAAFEIGGRKVLAISDFGLPGIAKTCIVAIDRAAELASRSVENVAEVCYDNSGFSQGLAFAHGLLYEAVNAIGRDRIRALDVSDAVRTHDGSRVVEVAILEAPGDAVEDLATDGETLWTSDEESFRFYALPNALRTMQE